MWGVRSGLFSWLLSVLYLRHPRLSAAKCLVIVCSILRGFDKFRHGDTGSVVGFLDFDVVHEAFHQF